MLTNAMLRQFFFAAPFNFMYSFLGYSAIQILYELLEDYQVRAHRS